MTEQKKKMVGFWVTPSVRDRMTAENLNWSAEIRNFVEFRLQQLAKDREDFKALTAGTPQ